MWQFTTYICQLNIAHEKSFVQSDKNSTLFLSLLQYCTYIFPFRLILQRSKISLISLLSPLQHFYHFPKPKNVYKIHSITTISNHFRAVSDRQPISEITGHDDPSEKEGSHENQIHSQTTASVKHPLKPPDIQRDSAEF